MTMNFDACRDLSGRRIRHVRVQQELQQWHSERAEEEKKIEEELEEYKKHEREINNAIKNNDAAKDAMVNRYKAQLDASANNITNGVMLGKARQKRKHQEMMMTKELEKDNGKYDIPGEEGDFDMEDFENQIFQQNTKKSKRIKIDENEEKEIKEKDDLLEDSLMIKRPDMPEDQIENLENQSPKKK